MRRKPRKLSPEDWSAWRYVTDSVVPLANRPLHVEPEGEKPVHPSGKSPMQAPPPRPAPRRHVVPEPPIRIDLAPDPMHRALRGAVAMDAKAFDRLKRGKLKPEARIDLHGMTAERAHGALRHFIADAHGRGLRLVLVITGKGRGGPDGADASTARRGILRNAVPQWLALPPLVGLVLDIVPAHQRHGGGGAYYIYLRRRR